MTTIVMTPDQLFEADTAKREVGLPIPGQTLASDHTCPKCSKTEYMAGKRGGCADCRQTVENTVKGLYACIECGDAVPSTNLDTYGKCPKCHVPTRSGATGRLKSATPATDTKPKREVHSHMNTCIHCGKTLTSPTATRCLECAVAHPKEPAGDKEAATGAPTTRKPPANAWTKYDDDTLRSEAHLGAKHCAEKLGRSVRAVYERGSKLCVSFGGRQHRYDSQVQATKDKSAGKATIVGVDETTGWDPPDICGKKEDVTAVIHAHRKPDGRIDIDSVTFEPPDKADDAPTIEECAASLDAPTDEIADVVPLDDAGSDVIGLLRLSINAARQAEGLPPLVMHDLHIDSTIDDSTAFDVWCRYCRNFAIDNDESCLQWDVDTLTGLPLPVSSSVEGAKIRGICNPRLTVVGRIRKCLGKPIGNN